MSAEGIRLAHEIVEERKRKLQEGPQVPVWTRIIEEKKNALGRADYAALYAEAFRAQVEASQKFFWASLACATDSELRLLEMTRAWMQSAVPFFAANPFHPQSNRQ